MEEMILSIHPRRFARKMAKAQLDHKGATGYNDQKKAGSTFSRVWRAFAIEAMKPRNKKGAKKK